MQTIVGVRFKPAGKIYSFGQGQHVIQEGDYVIVETVRGMECGRVVTAPHDVPDASVPVNLRSVHRVADPSDLERIEENHEKEREARVICEQKIKELGLKMKLVDVELTFDLSKMLFYFTADGRVDFRQLVRELASVFRTRIELRQIGVRDEAKMMGGMGCCGRPLCCSTFLGDFVPVSIRMAKEQNLSLNPTKISGICGRLMCCLKYESNGYGCDGCMKQQKEEYIPVQGDRVLVEEGEGRVVAVHEQRRTATILMDDGKTVVSSWEDVGRAEGEEHSGGGSCPMRETQDSHAPQAHLVHDAPPRSRRERNERSERPAHRRHTGEGGGRRTPREAKRSQGQHRAVRARRTEQIPSE